MVCRETAFSRAKRATVPYGREVGITSIAICARSFPVILSLRVPTIHYSYDSFFVQTKYRTKVARGPLFDYVNLT